MLERISANFDYEYTSGNKSANMEISPYYNPDHVAKLASIQELAAAERALVEKHKVMPNRPQTISWRLLGYHAEYIEMYAHMLIAKAQGHDYETRERMAYFEKEFGKYELAIERYYDQSNTFYGISNFNKSTKSVILE